jgi:hypothetical protein
MLQLSLDNVGELLQFCDRCRRFFAGDRGRRRRNRSYLGGFFPSTQSAEMFPNLVGEFVVKRTGVRLLLNPQYGKIL